MKMDAFEMNSIHQDYGKEWRNEVLLDTTL